MPTFHLSRATPHRGKAENFHRTKNGNLVYQSQDSRALCQPHPRVDLKMDRGPLGVFHVEPTQWFYGLKPCRVPAGPFRPGRVVFRIFRGKYTFYFFGMGTLVWEPLESPNCEIMSSEPL